MSFTATTEVAINLRWRQVSKMFLNMVSSKEILLDEVNKDRILNHFAYLLQVTSWKHNIDWQPKFNQVAVAVPNEWGIDTMDFDAKVHRDMLSQELILVIKEVPVERVMSHFTTE